MNKLIDNLSNSIVDSFNATKTLPTTFRKLKFKQKFSFSERLNESTKIIKKYPDRIPVIVQKSNLDKETKCINKRKYLVPRSLTVGQFLFVIRKRLMLGPEKALFLFVNDGFVPPVGSLLGTIYEENADEDKFLYITYSAENTFGSYKNYLYL